MIEGRTFSLDDRTRFRFIEDDITYKGFVFFLVSCLSEKIKSDQEL